MNKNNLRTVEARILQKLNKIKYKIYWFLYKKGVHSKREFYFGEDFATNHLLLFF